MNTKHPSTKTARLMHSFQSVTLTRAHRNYGDETPALRDYGLAPGIASALIRWGETEDLVCTFTDSRGVGRNAYSWQPRFIRDAVCQELDAGGNIGKKSISV